MLYIYYGSVCKLQPIDIISRKVRFDW